MIKNKFQQNKKKLIKNLMIQNNNIMIKKII